MSNAPGGPGWLLGQDGKWYPGSIHPQSSEMPSSPYQLHPEHQSFIPGATPQEYSYYPAMQGGCQTGSLYGQTVKPKKPKRRAIIAIIVVVVLLIGGGTTGYMVLTSNSDNPTSVVNSFMAALLSKNAHSACSYTTGETTGKCVSEFGMLIQAKNISGSLRAANYVASGTEALVSVVGQECGLPAGLSNVNNCSANSNPSYGLPGSNTPFGQAWVNATSTNSSIFVVSCEKVNGTWYVYLVLSSKFDDPTSAVNSFMSALFSGNRNLVCNFATGVPTGICDALVNDIYSGGNISGSLKAANYVVSGTEALVTVVGQVCGGVFAQPSGKKCQVNGNPSEGLPSQGMSFARAWSYANSSNSSIFVVTCEKFNGTWYVYLHNAQSNSGNFGSQGTSSPNAQPARSYFLPMKILGAGNLQPNNTMLLLVNFVGNKRIVQINLTNGSLGASQEVSSDVTAIAESLNGVIAIGTSAGKSSAVELRNGINGATIATIPLSAPVEEISPVADGSGFYVLIQLDGISVVQFVPTDESGVIGASIPVPGNTVSIAITADGNYLFYLEQNGEVAEISGANNTSQIHIRVGANAKELALSSYSQSLYVLKCSMGTCSISVVDIPGQQVEKVIPAPNNTVQIQGSLDGTEIWDIANSPAFGIMQAFYI